MANPLKILAIKSFRITHQIHAGYASQFVKGFSTSLMRISTNFNCRFKVEPFAPGARHALERSKSCNPAAVLNMIRP